MKNINRLNDRVALKQENVISEKRNKEEINRDIERNANVDLALDNMVVRICFEK